MPSQEFEQLIAGMRAQARPAEPVSLDQQRAGFETMMSAFPLGPDVMAEPVTANGVKGELISTPDTDPSRAILYLPGGAYILGSSASPREMVSRLVRASGARALVTNYRLAPENAS